MIANDITRSVAPDRTPDQPPDIVGFDIGRRLRSFSDRAAFEGRRAGQESEPVLCWVFEQNHESPDVRVNRFLEASFLRHPNLLQTFAAGIFDGRVYAITEPFDVTLADPHAPYAADPVSFDRILSAVCTALSWLHSQGLVYCALREEFVVRYAGVWKLADFSELRVSGRAAPEETRRLLIRRDLYVPPEAYEGVVSPAWDAWSLGVLIQELCAVRASASGRNPSAMPQLSDLIRDLADPDPSKRPTIDEVASRLSQLRGRETSVQPSSEGIVVPAPAADQVAAESAENEHASPLRSPVADHETLAAHSPPPVHSNDRLRIAAIVTLVFGAILILATLYAHPGAAHRKPSATAPSGQTNPSPFSRAGAAANATSANDEKSQVSALLDRWAQATRQGDVTAQSDCYASVVRQYFGRHDVSKDAIRRANERAFQRVGPAHEFAITGVRFDRLTPDQAIVSFLKTWDFPKRHFAGSVREEMVLQRDNDAWKIASERELNPPAARSRVSRLPGPDITDPDSILSGEAERSTHAFTGNQ